MSLTSSGSCLLILWWPHAFLDIFSLCTVQARETKNICSCLQNLSRTCEALPSTILLHPNRCPAQVREPQQHNSISSQLYNARAWEIWFSRLKSRSYLLKGLSYRPTMPNYITRSAYFHNSTRDYTYFGKLCVAWIQGVERRKGKGGSTQIVHVIGIVFFGSRSSRGKRKGR